MFARCTVSPAVRFSPVASLFDRCQCSLQFSPSALFFFFEDLSISGNSVLVSGWVKHPFRLHGLFMRTGRKRCRMPECGRGQAFPSSPGGTEQIGGVWRAETRRKYHRYGHDRHCTSSNLMRWPRLGLLFRRWWHIQGHPVTRPVGFPPWVSHDSQPASSTIAPPPPASGKLAAGTLPPARPDRSATPTTPPVLPGILSSPGVRC